MPKAAERLQFVLDEGEVVFVEQFDEIPPELLDMVQERVPGDRILPDDSDPQAEPDPSFSLASATVEQIKVYIEGDVEPPARARKVLRWEESAKMRKTVLEFCRSFIANPPAPPEA